jgi:hypothetical protein
MGFLSIGKNSKLKKQLKCVSNGYSKLLEH